MHRLSRRNLGVITIFTLFIFFGAFSAFAVPGSTSECGGCHPSHPSYTMSSNATGTVEAYIGIPFTLAIDSIRPIMGGGDFFFSIQSGWANNDNFTFTPTVVEDNQAGDLNPAQWTISVEIEFIPESVGTYTIRAWCASETNSRSIDITVDVSDPTPPTIDSPSDMQISEGNVSESVTWNPTDGAPDRYEIFDNGAVFASGAWDGSSITVGLGTLTMGSHNITCVVYDVSDNTAVDQVNVSVVDDTSPSIIHLNNRIVSEGSVGSLTWVVSDLHPSVYEVFKDEVTVESDVWDGRNIVVSLSGLPIGEYNYTVLVFDTSGNFDIDTVFVSVIDDTNPTIDHPGDVAYQVSTVGHNITWTPSDTHPEYFSMSINGAAILSGGWNGQPIVVNIDWLSIGTYDYTITVTDASGNSITDSVTVTVTPYDPADPPITETTTTTTTTTSPDGNTGVLSDDEQEAATFSMIILSMGVIIGLLSVLLLFDRRRK